MSTKNRSNHRPEQRSGRELQKLRTRRNLTDAVLRLIDAGRMPTMEDIAAEAMVSRATVYRYANSAESLIADATLARAAGEPEALAARVDLDPIEQVGLLAAAVNRLFFEREFDAHVLLRSFMQVWIDERDGARTPRPGRRREMIERVLERFGAALSPTLRTRLHYALCLVMGSEAYVTLRDVTHLDADDALAVSAWAAVALTRAALDESAREADRGKPAPREARRARRG